MNTINPAFVGMTIMITQHASRMSEGKKSPVRFCIAHKFYNAATTELINERLRDVEFRREATAANQ